MDGRIIIASNRLPVTAFKNQNGSWEFKRSSGGLVTALNGLKKAHLEYYWIGWLGVDVAQIDQANVSKVLWEEHQAVPVYLESNLSEPFYNGFCNSVIWPLFHYFSGDFQFNDANWKAYCQVNQIFERALEALNLSNSDIVWIHDYHLMLLPLLLRQNLGSNCPKIGFFLHTPFPSSEIFRLLPVRENVLQGIVASDLIGFQTHDHARHFTRSCESLLSATVTSEGVEYNGKLSRIDIDPVGIDPSFFTKLCGSVNARIMENTSDSLYFGKQIILGVDRLDYIKGLLQKVAAFKNLLENFPQLCGQIIMIQIAIPSRIDIDEYADLRAKLFEQVGIVNGKFGQSSYTPIQLINQTIGPEELARLYMIADVCMVSSIRDGMNLVSLEYVACQKQNNGVLLLSKFAGAAQSLSGAVLFNPWNIEEMSNVLRDSLTMPEDVRKSNHNQLMTYVEQNTSMNWSISFIENLKTCKAQVDKITTNSIESKDYASASVAFKAEILICDLETMEKAFVCHEDRVKLLNALKARENFAIILYSDMDIEAFDCLSWCYDLGFIAEQGCLFRAPKSNKWEVFAAMDDPSWDSLAEDVFELFLRRTPGSVLTKSMNSWVWKFLYGDPQFYSLQAQELKDCLVNKLARRRVQIVQKKRSLSILPTNLNRRDLLNHILEAISTRREARFLFLTQAMSDDYDELDDLIECVPKNLETIKLAARKISHFKEMVYGLLERDHD